MFVENLIACRLVSVEITISKNSTFDGKSNTTICHYLQESKRYQGKRGNQHLKRYLRTLLIGPFFSNFKDELILKTVNIGKIREKFVLKRNTYP